MSLSDEFDQTARGPKRTHRGRRSKGKGAKAHHADAKGHMANAQKAPTPAGAMGHLFKAVRSLHAAKAADPQSSEADAKS